MVAWVRACRTIECKYPIWMCEGQDCGVGVPHLLSFLLWVALFLEFVFPSYRVFISLWKVWLAWTGMDCTCTFFFVPFWQLFPTLSCRRVYYYIIQL